MNSAPSTAASADQVEYARAVEFLRSGRVRDGAALLTRLAGQARDPDLAAQSAYNLGETLAALGAPAEAYAAWYRQAHKPPAQRRPSDWLARIKVMQWFDQHGLRLDPPDFPPRVQIEVTNRCNLRCRMCTRNQMRRTLGDFPFQHLRKIADECAANGPCTIQLFYLGEPLLHRGLAEMVRYLASVRQRGPVPLGFGIQTNAMLLTKARARELLAAGLREISCSVDGLAGDLERLRPGAKYEVVERNILDLLALRDELGLHDLKVEISKLTDDAQSDEVRRFCAHWTPRVDRVNLLRYTKVAGNAILSADGTLQTVVAPSGADHAPRYCGQGQRLVVQVDGNCTFCDSDVNGELTLGNIADHTISEIWNGEAMRRLRDNVFAVNYADLPPCGRCPLA